MKATTSKKHNMAEKSVNKKPKSVFDYFNEVHSKKCHDSFVKVYMATGLSPEQRLLKEIFNDKSVKVKKCSKEEAERAYGEYCDGSVLGAVRFDKNLLIECLQEFNDWRRGVGKYEFNKEPKKNKECPFTPMFIGYMIDIASEMLTYADDGQYKEDYKSARKAALKDEAECVAKKRPAKTCAKTVKKATVRNGAAK